jgi:hypothetical protein
MSELSHKRARLLIQQKELSTEENRRLAAHLVQCEECRRYASIHIFLSRNLNLEAVRTKPTPELKAEILNRVQKQRINNLIIKPIRTFAAIAVIFAIVIFAWSLFRSAPEQLAPLQPQVDSMEVPTRTPRPTLTPLPTRFQDMLRQITTPEEIAGVWGFDKGPVYKLYYQFNRDGTYSSSKSANRERLENSPSLIGEFWFEGSRLKLNIIDKNVGNACLGVVGVYEVHLLENGALRFDLIDDECTFRSRELSVNDFEPTEVTE